MADPNKSLYEPTEHRTTLDECADAAGSFNNPNTPNSGLPPIPAGTIPSPGGGVVTPPNVYVPPDICIGDFTISQNECAINDSNYQQSLAAQQLAISGAPLNVFKLLGNHEQGKLIDLVGHGHAIGSDDTSMAFDELAGEWTSSVTGLAVTQTPAYVGYDFGYRLTSYGQLENAKGQPADQHITSIRITQGPDANTRALQVRVDRSDGDFIMGTPIYTATGNGTVTRFSQGIDTKPGAFMLFATSPTKFSVMWTGNGTYILGDATVGQMFDSKHGSFVIAPGTIPFAAGDAISVPIQLEWKRVDVVNLPNVATPALIRIKQSAPSRFWRIVPTSFAGVTTNSPWVVEKLELFDYQATMLTDIQDPLFMENRDRDYAKTSIQLKVAYTPFDAVSDLTKFGFQVADIYSFTTTFATMVEALGRPIVVGDVLELPSEMQWDQNMRPVRKFLEVTDGGWAADGYTTGWQPIIYRFQAQQLIPGQEHRDLLGTLDTQKYVVDDGRFFDGIEQISTGYLTAMENNEAEARKAVPETGTNVREAASGTNRFNQPGSYDGVGVYVEDGLPPDGHEYKTGFDKLPDVAEANDGDYFRLEYSPERNLPARLYKFSGVKNRWIFVETDRRNQRSSHTPSQREIFALDKQFSPTAKKIS